MVLRLSTFLIRFCVLRTPAKSFGHPWTELFYECKADQEIECFVKVFGLGRREKDILLKIWLLEINDGLRECFGASDSGLELIHLDEKWSTLNASGRSELWPEIQQCLLDDVSFDLRYGQWDEVFQLHVTYSPT